MNIRIKFKNKLLFIFLAAMGLFWAATPATAADPAGAPVLHLVLDLSDGSRIIGTPSIGSLKVTTQYADLEIQLARLRTIEFSGTDHAAQLNLKNGDMLNGQLAAKEIAMKTLVGDVVIPLAEVRRMRVGGGGALPDGLVLHYTFDSDDGDKVVDASDSGNDGAVHGAEYSKEGKIGGAMNFSGNASVVYVKNAESLQLQDFTVMAWIKRANTKTASTRGDGGFVLGYGQAGYGVGITHEGRLCVSKIGFSGVYSTQLVTDTAFHHVAFVKNGSKVVFYIDGVADPAVNYDIHFEFSTPLGVGARPDNLDNTLTGTIDELMVFKRALSDDEVQEIYESQK